MNRDNLNKKIEETKKNFEKMFSCPVSYHEEGGWDGKNGHFTIKLGNSEISDTPKKKVYSHKEIEKRFEDKGFFVSYHEEDIGGGKKRGVLTPIKKTVDGLEKALGKGQPVNFQIENQDVSKDEFINWVETGKNVKVPPKETLVYGVKGNIDGSTYFTERKGKDGAVEESCYEPRSEEDKKMIIERNRKRRELENSQETKKTEDIDLNKLAKEVNREKSQTENSSIKETSQQNLSQKLENNRQNIYYGVGLISLVLLATSLVVVKIKKKK